MPKPDIDNYIFEQGQLTRNGLYLIHHYYSQKNIYPPNTVFIIRHPTEMKLLEENYRAENKILYFICSHRDGHQTVICKRENTVVIIDSKGKSDTYYQEIKRTIREAYASQSLIIYYTIQQQQADLYSCGTYSLVTVKHCLRLQPNIFAFVIKEQEPGDNEYQVDQLPPNLVKYIQTDELLFGNRGYFTLFPLLQNTQVHSKQGNITITDYISQHRDDRNRYSNTAIVSRREKFRRIIENYLRTFTDRDFEQVVANATGTVSMTNGTKSSHVLSSATSS